MIQLRELKPDDRNQLLAWRNLPEVSRYMYTDHIITAEEHDKWFEGVFTSDKKRYWIIQLDSEDVGLVSITDIDRLNRSCFWAFYLASPSVRGRGVGSFVEYSIITYVLDELGLNKLCCEVLTFNNVVIDMHKSFGFKQEGLFREQIFKQGQFYDVMRLALLKSEWQSIRPDIEQRLRDKGLIV